MVSVLPRETPSITSISPLSGQLGPKSHMAGQTPQMDPGLFSTIVSSAWKKKIDFGLTCGRYQQ
jgi:hypothetical protein